MGCRDMLTIMFWCHCMQKWSTSIIRSTRRGI